MYNRHPIWTNFWHKTFPYLTQFDETNWNPNQFRKKDWTIIQIVRHIWFSMDWGGIILRKVEVV